jgi:hypothetical protein
MGSRPCDFVDRSQIRDTSSPRDELRWRPARSPRIPLPPDQMGEPPRRTSPSRFRSPSRSWASLAVVSRLPVKWANPAVVRAPRGCHARGSSSDPLAASLAPGLLCFAAPSCATALVCARTTGKPRVLCASRQAAGGPPLVVSLSEEDPSRARRAAARPRRERSKGPDRACNDYAAANRGRRCPPRG